MNRIAKLLSQRKWRQSWAQLLHVLEAGTLSVQEYEAWGGYAGKIENGLGQKWVLRERFWRDLSRIIAGAELREGVRTHKGLIFFKVGAMCLFSGRKFLTVIRWLERAYEEDRRFFDLRHERLPHQQSAYRMLLIVRALDQFVRENSDAKHVISTKGSQVGLFFGQVYDYTLSHPPILPRVNIRAFDQLLRRNPYRVRVEQSYRAAEWMLRQKKDLLGSNLEQYGVAEAAVVLCGTTIEGILLRNKTVRRKLRRKKIITLGDLAISYIASCRPTPIMTVALIFVWYARNLIHPGRWKKAKGIIIDMNFADFTLTLTGSIIARMAKRSHRK